MNLNPTRLFILICLSALPITGWGADLFVGDRASNFTLKSNQGENLRLSEQRGQVIFLTFWAEWCGTCKQQLKALESIYQQQKHKGFQVWGISLDEDNKEADLDARSMGLSFPILYDAEHKISKAYDIDDLPFAVIVDRDGIIRYTKEDYKTKTLTQYQNQVTKLVNE